jgi:hypothetical protein
MVDTIHTPSSSRSTSISIDVTIARLQQEYDRVATHIRLLESTNDKIAGMGITITIAGFAYGIQANIDVMFFFLPVAFIGIFLYATLQYLNVFWMGGYARAIEDKINELSGGTLIHWETLIATVRPRRNFSNIALIGLYLLIFVGVTYYCFDRIFSTYTPLVRFTYAGVVSVLSICLLVSLRHMLTAYNRSYSSSCTAYGLR